MMDRTQWNTRERALSTDLNRAMQLVERGVLEGLSALVSGSVKKSGCFGNSFLVTPVAGTMDSSITAGLAFMINAANVYPSSTVDWIESRVLRSVTHDAADAQTRYDAVEMRAGYEVSSSQPRDQFNPVTGTFTVVNMAKELASLPEFRITKGTPAASPQLPAGSAGWMPLAYVRVVGGAATLSATDVIYCRPLLDTEPGATGWAGASADVFSDEVTGGNLSCAGGTLTGAVVNTMTGRFAGFHHRFRVAVASTCTLGSLVYDGGGLPGASGHVYFYAIPAPYPSGYDTSMAGREFWTPDEAVVYSAAGGFADPDSQSGCIIIASSEFPGTSKSGAPPAGTALFSHSLFGPGLTTTSNRKYWMYIGSAWYDSVGGTLLLQSANGPRISHSRKTGSTYTVPVVDEVVSFANEVVGDPDFSLPPAVTRVHVVSNASLTINTGFVYIKYEDADPATGTTYKKFLATRVTSTDALAGISEWMTVGFAKTIIVRESTGDILLDTVTFHAIAWEDPVIALR